MNVRDVLGFDFKAPDENEMKRMRVVLLCEKLMLCDFNNQSGCDIAAYDSYAKFAEDWIRLEDAYVLPDDLRVD